MDRDLALFVDTEEANRLLRSLLTACPSETVYQVSRLFIDGNAPYESGTLFSHAFIAVESEADGTVDSVIRFRVANPDEFATTVRALYVKVFVVPGTHDDRSLVGVATAG
jgi:hypothetical protein